MTKFSILLQGVPIYQRQLQSGAQLGTFCPTVSYRIATMLYPDKMVLIRVSTNIDHITCR
jgi:hypothetical protein